LASPATLGHRRLTSGDAAQMGMLSGAVGRKVHHIGALKDEPFFTDFADDLAAYAATQPDQRVALKDAEGIVCTGLADDLTETPDDYRAALLWEKPWPANALRQPGHRRRHGRQAALLRRRAGAGL
jgi:hypothetical protein